MENQIIKIIPDQARITDIATADEICVRPDFDTLIIFYFSGNNKMPVFFQSFYDYNQKGISYGFKSPIYGRGFSFVAASRVESISNAARSRKVYAISQVDWRKLFTSVENFK